MNEVFTITARGLETISAGELAEGEGVAVGQVAYRRIFATCHGALTPLLRLRTVDDVFLYAAIWSGFDRQDWPAAEKLAREALPLSEWVKRQEMIGYDLWILAKALAWQGRPAEGLPYARRVVEIFAKLR